MKYPRRFLLSLALTALASTGCVIATPLETVVESIDDDILLQGTHLYDDGAILIEALDPETGEFDVVDTVFPDSGPFDVLGLDLYLWSRDAPIPTRFWRAGWAGAAADLRLTAITPGQPDFPLDVVTDPDFGLCLSDAEDITDFRDHCTTTTGEGLLTVMTEDYCLVPSVVFHPGGCISFQCGDTIDTTCPL